MNINFEMWKKASWQLIKMDDKSEWDQLDAFSKWLIATRSAVTMVTIYSGILAGFLAWRSDHFELLPWLIVTIGLFIAHGTNNLLNDYTDFTRGVDADNYFRTQYGVHPLVQGFWTTSVQIKWFIISGVLATATGIYALWFTYINHPEAMPYVVGLFAFGAFVLLFYTWPMKYFALGELAIFLIWGPIMIGGVYLVLSGMWDWMVVLAGIPWGLTVASINIAKHTDKLIPDKAKKVGSFPVRAGEKVARYTTILTIVAAYAIIIYLVIIGYFAPVMLLVLFGIKRAFFAIAILSKPRPTEAPKGFELYWPTYLSGMCFYHNRIFGGMLVLGFLFDALLHKFLPATVIGLGLTQLNVSVAILVIGLIIAAIDMLKAKKQ